MQQVSCPGCGAPVQFKSAASIMAVCEFCKTTLLKDAQSVKDLGKMSAVLEDYSPLQIGTSGQYDQRAFSLIGRIQLQYDDGFWNEWYALFDDGSSGWLADASGQFTFTVQQNTDVQLPLFDKIVPGRSLGFDSHYFTASDVRTARCTAGQGELPFRVGQGCVARVADFRSGDRFLTLDYSDSERARVYSGRSVELAALKPQLLRDTDQISDAAGRFHGKVTPLNCPACGSTVQCVPGITVHILCPSCHAEVDTSGAVATILAAGRAVERETFTLALGTMATIAGARYTILGTMRRSDGESQWSEYLLYAPGRKFIWLVETSDGWWSAAVLDRWPATDAAGHAMLDNHRYDKDTEYDARVSFAAGSFNWRVKVGDVVHVTEFVSGSLRLAAERSTQEMTWSRSSALSADQLHAWFGSDAPSHIQQTAVRGYRATAKRILIALCCVNAIPMLLGAGQAIAFTLLAAAAIWLPAYFLDRADGNTP